ncbi:hypothetical protein EON80_12255 [bacterium]|nr:MAG: hypothetical protein EON80_12255 [bacterium]
MLELIGLPLSVAHERLPTPPVVVETAPPFAPKNRVPVWGELRVLRAREREGQLELLVARELLAEDASPSSPPKPL